MSTAFFFERDVREKLKRSTSPDIKKNALHTGSRKCTERARTSGIRRRRKAEKEEGGMEGNEKAGGARATD